MWKILIYIIAVVWCAATLPKAYREYKDGRNKADLFEVIGRILLIPSGIILLLSEIVG